MSTAVDPALTPPEGMTRFMVDPVKCIGCEACNNGFPKAFKFDREKNVAYTDTPVPSAEYKNDEVTGVCPTSAIYVVGAPPPTPEQLAEQERKAKEHIADLARRSRTIEQRIGRFKQELLKHGDLVNAEDAAERDRRYGLACRVEETSSTYEVRVEMPRRIPDSHVRRKMGLGTEMPDYEVVTRILDGHTLEIHARLTDPQILKLAAGSSPAASFPPQFLRQIRFARPVGACRRALHDKVLTVTVDKA